MLDMPNWQEITALIAGSALMGGFFMWATRSIVRDEIRRLNGTYLRTDVAEVRFGELDKRITLVAEGRKRA
jgi:hypothetical protein